MDLQTGSLKESLNDKPTEHRLAVLRVSRRQFMIHTATVNLYERDIPRSLQIFEQNLEIRKSLLQIGSEVFVPVAGDDIGLTVRFSINEAGRGDDMREMELRLLAKKIKELEEQMADELYVEKAGEAEDIINGIGGQRKDAIEFPGGNLRIAKRNRGDGDSSANLTETIPASEKVNVEGGAK